MVVYEDQPSVSDPPPSNPAHRKSRYPQDSGAPLQHIPVHPSFHKDTFSCSVGDWDFCAPNSLTFVWLDDRHFLASRYGLEGSDVLSGERRIWNKKIGLKPADPFQDVVQLYTDVVSQRSWSSICDLSPEIRHAPGVFPSRNPADVLVLTKTQFGYVVAVQDGVARPWKLLISDPLTVVQIEREGISLDGRNLIVNLVLKGLPFEILLNNCVQGPFHPYPIPVPHPDGRDPRLADYYAYRHDLADFLSEYPHAKAAALCAGGILWRLALDVHPFSSEADIIGPFNASCCISRTIDGETYWTPRLTVEEQNVLVGVYRWAIGKSNPNVAFVMIR